MAIWLELTSDEEARLAATARQMGVDARELAHRLVIERLPDGVVPSTDPMLALFAEWDADDSPMTPEDVAGERRAWEQLKAGMNAERDRADARRLF